MEKIYLFFILIFLKSNICCCQLLENPSLTVKDIEVSLSNPDHLRSILLEHNFKFEKFESEDYIISECWQSKVKTLRISKQGSIINAPVICVCIYKYKPNHEPESGIVVSVGLQIYKDPIIAEKLEMFIDSIRSCYPERNAGVGNGSNPVLYYNKRGSKIGVEVSNMQTELSDYDWYILTFNLYDSPYFL